MKPISQLNAEEARGLAGVLFDLDDTLLDHGKLTLEGYSALFRLSRGGLRLFAVTGRPAGWAEVVARQWPIDGATAENGAIAFVRSGDTLRLWDPADPATRAARRARLAEVYEALRTKFPVARLSDDTRARVSDLAIDIGESQQVAPETVRAMAEFARERGLHTFVSSVHLHLTLDATDKAAGTIALLEQTYGEDPSGARRRYAYLGDSPNDASCFAAFETSCAVANVRAFLGQIPVPPRYVADYERSQGFAQIADRILAQRGAQASG